MWLEFANQKELHFNSFSLQLWLRCALVYRAQSLHYSQTNFSDLELEFTPPHDYFTQCIFKRYLIPSGHLVPK